MKFINLLIYIFLLHVLTACQTSNPVHLLFPDQNYSSTKWTAAEQQKAIAIQHLIRLKGKELPHYHDKHDLNVSLLSGNSIIHFKGHEVRMKPGDVVFIPQGTYHWAENTDPVASVVFAVFSPAFDGKDKRLAE